MSLVDNAQNVAFTTRWPTDKIVGVWEGSYNRATEVVTRTFTSGGMPYDVFFYRIPHGFTRPVFCDLLWSTDNVVFSDGGSRALSVDPSIAFSDSTYIYIYDSQGAASAGTAYYKVIAVWIDEYDGTNPLVQPFVSTTKDILFDTRLNYQKIYQQGVLTFNSAGIQSVDHELLRRPNFRVYFESFSGEVWPMHNGSLFTFDDNQTECKALMFDTGLAVQLISVPSARRAWYKVYLDQ